MNITKELDTERVGTGAFTSWPPGVAAIKLLVCSQPLVLHDKDLTKDYTATLLARK